MLSIKDREMLGSNLVCNKYEAAVDAYKKGFDLTWGVSSKISKILRQKPCLPGSAMEIVRWRPFPQKNV